MKNVTVTMLMLACGLVPSAIQAQTFSFTRDLFEKKSHDFGTVARAAQIDYVFEFTNNTKNTIQMSSVRTSCNCTTPTIVKKTIKPGEKGGVKCKFNTRSFLGSRRATVTVSFSRPYFAEVQLQVKGYVRRDIVVHPPAIDFKNIREGAGGSQKVGIEYAGSSDWKISGVQSSSSDVEVELKETHRGKGLVGYELVANLKKNAKPGYLNNLQLVLQTNDKQMNQFPISIVGKVEEAISVSPAQIDLPDAKSGETISKRVIVKGSEPFQILSVHPSDERVEAKITSARKKLHIVPVTMKVGNQSGKINASLEIVTDMGGVRKTIDFSGNVIE
ncbi:MAG: DUF1573 domain-containing protein [Planctomycetota bacterium]|nr:DUF1573 domain-containing protein [Planctomycetota bacterium]